MSTRYGFSLASCRVVLYCRQTYTVPFYQYDTMITCAAGIGMGKFLQGCGWEWELSYGHGVELQKIHDEEVGTGKINGNVLGMGTTDFTVSFSVSALHRS